MPNVTRPSGIADFMYNRSVCTGNKKDINDSLESFPSGHSTAAFAGLTYLALYFNAQLKVMSAHNPAYWKMVLFFAPILGATLIAGALTIDKCETHHQCSRDAGKPDAFLARPSLLGRHRRCFNRNCMRIRRLPSNVCLCLGLPVQSPPTPTHNVPPTPHAVLLRNFTYTFVPLPTAGRVALP